MTDVSFIVTVYHKAPYIPAVVNAILAQEGDFEREVFIIDDGSTDDSPASSTGCARAEPAYTSSIREIKVR